MKLIIRLSAAAVLVVMLAACASPGTVAEEITYVVTATDFDAGSDVVAVSVYRAVDGVQETDRLDAATVQVNGTSLTAGASGMHEGVLPAALAAGENITVTVSHESDVVTGTLTVPEQATLTAPSPRQQFPDTVATVQLQWIVTSAPDRYELWLTWGADGFTEAAVDGSAVEFDLDVTGLNHEHEYIMAQVVTVNEGSFSGPAHPDSALAAANIPARGLELQFRIGVPVPDALLLNGSLSGSRQSVSITAFEGGRGVAGEIPPVTVTVNGQPLAAPTGRSSAFTYNFDPPLAAGTPLELVISGYGGMQWTASGTVPASPLVNTPADGTIHSVGVQIPVSWSWPAGEADPVSFQIRILQTGEARAPYAVAGDARSYFLPVDAVFQTHGTQAGIQVQSVGELAYGGDGTVHGGSSLQLVGQPDAVPRIHVIP